MVQLKRNLLSVALASATMMLMAQAHAQTAQSAAQTEEEAAAAKKKAEDAKTLDKVVVTGIRGAIERAIDTKQESTSIVEAVSAEDIGKLPDQSIADSIARLPGITAMRKDGRDTQVNIRGFAGDFSATTLNGREQASTFDNRGVEFDQYPSELLSSVLVYKTPDAKLVGQGLSGTVDLRTVRPLDYDKRVVTFGGRFDQNKIRDQKENGKRYNVSYFDQFAGGTIGLAIGYAHMESPQPGYQNEPWGYTGFNGGSGPNPVAGANPDPTKQILGGAKFFKFDAQNKRDGLMATLQFRPNDFYEGALDLLYGKFKRTEVKAGAEFWTEWGGGTNVQPGWIATGNTVTESTWAGVYPVIRMDSHPVENKITSFGFNNKFYLDEHWTLNADISVSKAKSNFRQLETTAGIVGRTTTLHFALDPSGMFYNYDFGVDLGDPSKLVIRGVSDWGGQDGYLKNFNVNDKIESVRVNLVRNFDSGAFSSVDFGVNYTSHNKYKTDYEARLCLVACAAGLDEAPFPGSAIDFGVGGIANLGAYDANEAYEAGTWNLIDSPIDWFRAKSWNIDEKLTTLYFQANIDTELGNMPLRGNVGFQYLQTDQTGEGYLRVDNNGNVTVGDLVRYGDKYHHFLPSMNLSLELMPELQLRFAAAKQTARPPMDQMRGGMDVGICTTCGSAPIWSGGGGNPRLRPWLANAYDVSLEKYFRSKAGNRGYASLAYFYKDLVSYIWSQTVAFDFADAGIALPPANPGQTNYPATTIGQITQPYNGSNGSIKGTEVTVSVPLDMVWAPLNGLGITASYSDTKSSILRDGPGTQSPLPGLSKYVSNVTAYYERNGFGLRYNRRTRSSYLAQFRSFNGELAYDVFRPEVLKDAQVSYNFQSGPLQGLSFYLQILNIGNRPSARYHPDTGMPLAYFEYGKTTLAGFSYKF